MFSYYIMDANVERYIFEEDEPGKRDNLIIRNGLLDLLEEKNAVPLPEETVENEEDYQRDLSDFCEETSMRSRSYRIGQEGIVEEGWILDTSRSFPLFVELRGFDVNDSVYQDLTRFLENPRSNTKVNRKLDEAEDFYRRTGNYYRK